MPRPAGLPKTGGRKPGSRNKVTADVKEAAQAHTTDAIKELARIMLKSESDAARVAAIKEMLDRGHGKAKQAVDVEGAMGLTIEIVRFGEDQASE